MVSANPIPALCIFLGADRARKLQRLQELERSLRVHTLDRHQVDGARTDAKTLLALCRQQPAGSPVRLVVVDQADRLDAAGIEALGAQRDTFKATACVILLVEAAPGARHPLQAVLKQWAVEDFPARETLSAKPFALADALAGRNVGEALSAARDQYLAGREALDLFGLVAWQLNRWVMVKRLLGAGQSEAQVAAAVGMKPWQVSRVQREIAGRSLASLNRLLERCWQLVRDAKSGRAAPEAALEQCLVEVCVN